VGITIMQAMDPVRLLDEVRVMDVVRVMHVVRDMDVVRVMHVVRDMDVARVMHVVRDMDAVRAMVVARPGLPIKPEQSNLFSTGNMLSELKCEEFVLDLKSHK
jgi:hypothetical protein